MSDFNLGTARGTIELDYNGKNSAKQAETDINKIQDAGDKAGPALSKVSTGAAVAGAGIVAGFALALKTAGDFEKGLSGISAVSGATATQMDLVREKALKLGADTAFSASDAASAMEELVKAGISIPDVLNGAADATVALAAAGGIELPAAATIAANAMNQFGLSANEMPKIADKIAGAANSSAIDVTDFGNSMSQVGAVAHLSGLSFDDTALAITAMGNAGVKGSDAGTSLKSFLMGLQPQTLKQINLMDDLGITTKGAGNQFYDAAGKVKSMSEIAGVLGGALEGMSDKQKTAALETLFGSDAIRAAAVIAGTGAKGMDKLTASIDKTKAADVAKVRLGNMAGGVEALKGSAETFAIQIGSVLIPMMTSLITKLTGVINWFTQLDDGTKKLIVIVGLFAAGLLLVVAAAIKIAQAIKVVKAMQIALNTTFLASPIFWIILAIVALIAAFVLLYKNNEAFRNFVNKMWAGIKAAISATVGWITGTAVPWIVGAWDDIVAGAQALRAKIVSVWDAIVGGITTAVNAVKSVVTTVWGAISSTVMTVFNAIKIAVTTYFNVYKAIITTVLSVIWTVITTVFNSIKNTIVTILNVIKAVWSAVWGLFGPLVRAVWELIKAIIALAIRAVLMVISSVLNTIKSVWNSVWNAIKSVTSTVWNAIRSVVTTVFNAVKSFITTVVNAIKTTIFNVWNAIKSTTTTVWNAIKAALTGPINAAKATLSTVISAIVAFFAQRWANLKANTIAVWNAIKSALTGPINAAKATVTSVVDAIKNAVTTAFNAAKTAATTAFNGLRDAVGTAINAAKEKVSSAISTIKGFFSGAGSWLLAAGRSIIQGLIDGITAMVGNVTGAITGITDKIKGFLPGSPIKEGPLVGWNRTGPGGPGATLVDFLAEGIAGNLSAIESAFSGVSVGMPTVLGAPDVALNGSASRTGARGGLPAPPSEPGNTYSIGQVVIPAKDLEEMRGVQDFFDRIEQESRRRVGVSP